ncbi:hypothetical protein TCAL_14787 [Tigriopus californicus]|uniref:Ionotropic glutamate receptor C-terminal domain-containing protein n=2 Tax=Tigriopus californicus TaxID=6832 RepID=A0A553PNV4_TIGCA|nr:hypothetical protein TCAL_14787 [Tigriopus californicus]
MDKGFVHPFGLRGERCHHILFNQTFKVAHFGLMPNVFYDKSDNSVTGTDIEAVKLLAEKFKMTLELRTGLVEITATTADPNATHVLAKVYRGEFQGVIPGLQFYYNSVFFDLSNYILFSQLRYTSRVPQKTVTFGNVARGFDTWSWLAVFITLGSFSATFQLIYYVYKYKMKDATLYKNPGNPIDFFLLTFTTFVEPDKLKWFPSWSTGKFATLLWSIFALLVVSFYTSNLRTNLIAPNFEPEINSHEDILKYDKIVHVDNILIFLLELRVSPSFDEVLRIVKEKERWYTPVVAREILEPHIKKAVLENGDIFVATEQNILYTYLFEQDLGFPNLRISDDSLVNFYMCLRLTKYSPFTPDVNRMLTTYQEFGLSKRILNKPIPIIALPSTESSAQYESSENLKMSMEMLWTPIILLASGSMLGLAVFIVEIVLGSIS